MKRALLTLSLVASLVAPAAALRADGTAAGGADPAILKMKAAYKRPAAPPFPADNPYTAEKAKLGEMLFFDPRLSGANYISCASCHNPSLSWGDGLPRAIGHGMTVLGRRTPTILNSAWADLLMWDGRKSSLEDQALGPISTDVEMNQPVDKLVGKLDAIDGYRASFAAAFPGDGITLGNIAKAIATYERTIVSGEAPFDRWIGGDERAISESAKRGFVLFNTKANCAACHSGWNFTDGSFHDIGLPDGDIGRGAHVKVVSMQHAFKTPTLRDAVRRAPYMHDGSLATLAEVIGHYDRGGVARPSLSADMKPLHLTQEEKGDLLDFLATLDGANPPVSVPALYVNPQTAQR
jgi:cytochrome c peroxidase